MRNVKNYLNCVIILVKITFVSIHFYLNNDICDLKLDFGYLLMSPIKTSRGH